MLLLPMEKLSGGVWEGSPVALLTKHIHCIHMLAANHLWDPEDTVINELSVRLMQMVLLAALFCWLIIN